MEPAAGPFTDSPWVKYSREYLVITYAYLCPALLPVSLLGNALILCAFGRRAFHVPLHHRYFYVCIALGDILAVLGMHGLFIVAGDGLYWLSRGRLALYPDRRSVLLCRLARILWKAGELHLHLHLHSLHASPQTLTHPLAHSPSERHLAPTQVGTYCTFVCRSTHIRFGEHSQVRLCRTTRW